MNPSGADDRLSRIKTHWSLLFQGKAATPDAGTDARRDLLMHYYGAVYRYLLGIVRDAGVAEELTQDFAVRFLRGDFEHADPRRGRFRDFLKVSVRHLVIDHWRVRDRQKHVAQPLPADGVATPEAPAVGPESDDEFLGSWREELFARAWEALDRFEQQTGSPYHTVLRSKTQEPPLSSARIAEQLQARLGRPFNESGVRQILHRSREKFAELLLGEVEQSLEAATPQQLEQELIDLGLLDYCKSALARRESAG